MPTPTFARFTAVTAALAAALITAPQSQSLTPGPLPLDRGAAGAWQAIQKLTTTASLLHTTAHPDDEQGGMLTYVSRGLGVRTTMLTLNRGESGDNAIGAELFDALGLIRTEELRISDRYYGVDAQYYTSVVDYGFSKRLDEAIEKWGREHVLRDMVRVIRTERPWVIVSRWQGNQRDGHGQHQAAGLLSQEAWKAAANPAQFPEQIKEGLRPWQAMKLYMGGARENEAWTLRLESGDYSPVLGDSYANVARLGLSFQRSQNGGRYVPSYGPAPLYFVRLAPAADASAKEKSFFDGIDTSWPGLYRALGRTAPVGADARLASVEKEVTAAKQAFTMTDPSTSAPTLARGLTATRAALATLGSDPDVAHVLRQKERQFVDALVATLGIEVSAVAVPAGAKPPSGPFAAFAPAATLAPLVPGQSLDVLVNATSRARIPVTRRSGVVSVAGGRDVRGPETFAPVLSGSEVSSETFRVTLPTGARSSLSPPPQSTPPQSTPTQSPLTLRLTFVVEGVAFEIAPAIQRRESLQPYGYALRELVVLPEYAVAVAPRQAMLPVSVADAKVTVTVDVANNQPTAGRGVVALEAPSGWRVDPASVPFELAGDGARTQAVFTVTPASVGAGSYPLQAVVTANGKTFREGYDVIAHRDLETRYFYRPSTVRVAAVDVRIAPNLTVGYVMGVGDELPAALTQLGARVQLLDGAALASAPLDRFNAIVLGTRAYAVRADLRANNARLLDYAKNGGHLIVLYNTQELDPATQAPFPGKLPSSAEEVSEEDAAVTILAPDHPLFTTPNRITAADFDGWVEQRGSKFWTEWDAAYTPLLESHDRGQAPQRGGWLHARYGRGHYSYVAYAFHRQLPFGVPGAYRLMANLLSMGAR
jgi:LmbE family N-acetylglucosaminyl deacetylase